MFCSKCGIGLDKQSEFCSKCGTAVVRKTTAVPSSKSESNGKLSSKAAKPKPKKSSTVGTVITYIVTGLVVLVFGSAILSMGNDDEETKSGPTDSLSSESSAITEMGSLAVTESGIEVRAISINPSPEVPNQFVIDSGDVQGQLVSVQFSVTNGSNEEISISNSSVSAYIQEAEYGAEAIFSENGDWYVYETLGPGLSVTFDAFFDIPVGGSLTTVIFYTSSFLGEELEFSIN
jgi:hypothetical protein